MVNGLYCTFLVLITTQRVKTQREWFWATFRALYLRCCTPCSTPTTLIEVPLCSPSHSPLPPRENRRLLQDAFHSSAFNSVIPNKLTNKLLNLRYNSTLCPMLYTVFTYASHKDNTPEIRWWLISGNVKTTCEWGGKSSDMVWVEQRDDCGHEKGEENSSATDHLWAWGWEQLQIARGLLGIDVSTL